MKKIAIAGASALLAACSTTQPPLTAYTLGSGAQRSADQQALDFDKADLKLRIEPASRSIRGDVTLTFGARAPVRSIELDLDRNLPIDAIAVDGQPLAATSWRNPEGKLSIDLPQTLQPGKQVAVRVQYHGQPHVAKKAPWDGGFVWSQTPDGQPWVASAVQGEGCDLFWPCIDHPTGKAKLVDEHITVPSPLVAAGNGIAMGMDEQDGWRTYHWRTKNPSTYGISINVAPYKLLSGEYRSRYGNVIPLRMWYLPQNEKGAQELFAEFPQMLDFFESTIGPYPFGDEKMGVVETPHKGMEHQTINAYGNNYAKTAYGYDELLQHEFAHEWFGNQLTNANWDDMWLHEGLGSYMQPLYMQSLRGDMEYFASLMRQRAMIENKAPIVSGKPKLEEDVYDTKRGGPGQDIYNKGSLVMHTLRGLIGDEAFFRAVREEVYGTADPRPGNFAPRYGTTPEFMAIVKRVSGRDLDWFFQAYLYQKELPELQATRTGNTLQLAWKTDKDTPFPMPVEVQVGNQLVKLAMTDGRGSVDLPAGTSYTLDPHSKVLRRERHIERYHEWQEEQKKKKAKA
ncbi:peptidase M1 [Massilia sp. WF1]|uniref:M1 family metallopeptidase n=1 Tax=unclassified Massilia TaxID=2609279 RepID=UPI0006497D01|nr:MULTISPECIES: M1 family metallopeptidase [unclassified Massilia]ALK95589.1 peptidase M1 [Massilia sp. WG5]KLU35251.1 peptidase M1 [Massilia sp. WF1]